MNYYQITEKGKQFIIECILDIVNNYLSSDISLGMEKACQDYKLDKKTIIKVIQNYMNGWPRVKKEEC